MSNQASDPSQRSDARAGGGAGEWTVRAIGRVRSSRTEAIDDDWGGIEATIVLEAPYDAASVAELEQFSHIEVIFLFDRVDPATVHTGARVPRNNPAWPAVGIFAQRAKNRPNRLGLCTCELVAVEGSTLRVRGLDAIDGTPVLDIKPYLTEFAPRSEVRQPPWSHELMADYF
jgi:tRNA-Thr(GGU) m(6)t(6)A37 methyltransferase TsaA